jgi:hypothetical protein
MARCQKKREGQAFSCQAPYSAPNREMASCTKNTEEKREFWSLSGVMARCGKPSKEFHSDLGALSFWGREFVSQN